MTGGFPYSPRPAEAPRAGLIHTAGQVVAPHCCSEALEGNPEQEMGKGGSKTQRVWSRFEGLS